MTKAKGMLKYTVFICPIKDTIICFAFNWRNQSDSEIIEYIIFQSCGEILQMPNLGV